MIVELMTWVVHKFGGTSLANADCFHNVKSLVEDMIKPEYRVALVTSAIGGITNLLQTSLDQAAARDEMYLDSVKKLRSIHEGMVSTLISSDSNEYLEGFSTQVEDLRDLLRSVWLTGGYSQRIHDYVLGYGELWSTRLLTIFLSSEGYTAEFIDARDVLIVDNMITGVSVDWEQSQKLLDSRLSDIDEQIVVITGFVATDTEGTPTTLKRNGSDLSASIFGVLLKAETINIWTDVDGIYSADPNRVPDAVVLPQISYLEVLELAYFGAKILHPGTIAPAMKHDIPIFVKNSFNPGAKGTRIVSKERASKQPDDRLVQGIATIDNIALISVEGSGMIGVPGISQTLFAALRQREISVIMISQASSEYSICIAVKEEDGKASLKALNKGFGREIAEGHIQAIKLEHDCGILAAVGDQMVHQPGIASILFSALARARINVRSISQGSSERNISVILDRDDLTRGLRAVHSAFYLSHLTLSIGIIGIGLIGSSLLNQIRMQQKYLRDELNIDLRVNALANSKFMLLERSISLDNWRENFDDRKVKMDFKSLEDQVYSPSIPHSVIIDCSASQDVADLYEEWLDKGIHVITPNKKASSAEWPKYKPLRKFSHKGPTTNPLDKSTHYYYETTVGAGLPVITALKDLMKTGDKINSIEGVLSGTISYIFNELSEENTFSSIVLDAKHKGYTEPDPRDDLSGIDFARKLVILAREVGYEVELSDVDIERLVPDNLIEAESVTKFLDDLPSVDAEMRKMVTDAKKRGEVVRYVGSIKDGECKLSLKFYAETHPFANLKGGENIVLFNTQRYHEYPLIVQGPGAGAEVTSAGVFADLLRLADLLGNA